MIFSEAERSRRSRCGRARLARWCLGAAFLAGAGGAGCTQADTVVVVNVTGDVAGIQILRATVTIDDRIRMLSFPDPPRPIFLPTSFSLQIDRSVQGRVDVTLDGLDGAETELARGEGSLSMLNRGQRNDLEVMLTTGGSTPTPDGGTPDGATDDGSTAGDAADDASVDDASSGDGAPASDV